MSKKDGDKKAAKTAGIKAIRANIGSLLKRFQTLAAHPDHPQNTHPNIHLKNQVKLPADYEGMLGMMALNGLAAGMFNASAANQNTTTLSTSPSITDYALDIIDEIRKDREKDKDQNTAEHGHGSLARYGHKTICNDFDAAEDNAYNAALNAYHQDKEARINIEKSLRHYDHMLSYMQRDLASAPIPQYAM